MYVTLLKIVHIYKLAYFQYSELDKFCYNYLKLKCKFKCFRINFLSKSFGTFGIIDTVQFHQPIAPNFASTNSQKVHKNFFIFIIIMHQKYQYKSTSTKTVLKLMMKLRVGRHENGTLCQHKITMSLRSTLSIALQVDTFSLGC